MFTRIRNTVSKLYNSAILLALPGVEGVLVAVAYVVSFLEVREAALERHIEAHITTIVEQGKAHDRAIQSIQRSYAKSTARNLSAVGNARKEAEAAVAARTAVENILNNRG